MATKPQRMRVGDNHTKEKLSERHVMGIDWHMHAHTRLKVHFTQWACYNSHQRSQRSQSLSFSSRDWLTDCENAGHHQLSEGVSKTCICLHV